MASGSKTHEDQNDAINKQLSVLTLTSPLSSNHSLHAPPLPTLPFDIIPEILCRLPVKFLHQLRCVCKSWNSLISDSNFIKKHLNLSNTRHLHFVSYTPPSRKYILTSYPLESVFNNITTNFLEIEYYPNNFNGDYPWLGLYHFIDSCNGILCIADDYKGLVILWNPSIRKFKELPLFEKPRLCDCIDILSMTFGFGYDSFTDNYKVVVVLNYRIYDNRWRNSWVDKIEVKVHTLGTNHWRSIKGYPFDGVPIASAQSGKFVNDTINWLVSSNESYCACPHFIVSFDLAKESYQKILPPTFGGVYLRDLLALSVLKDCLCVTSGDDVWIMKEYGNVESWTKLFTIPYMREPIKSHAHAKAVYIFEDGQVLLKFIGDDLNLILYDPISGALKSTNFQNFPEVCVESLISPCSLC